MEKTHDAVCLVDACFEAANLALDKARSIEDARILMASHRCTIKEIVRATSCIGTREQKLEAR